MVEMYLGLSHIADYWLADDPDMGTLAHSCISCASLVGFALSVEVFFVRLDSWGLDDYNMCGIRRQIERVGGEWILVSDLVAGLFSIACKVESGIFRFLDIGFGYRVDDFMESFERELHEFPALETRR
jgi:hypothetical protein